MLSEVTAEVVQARRGVAGICAAAAWVRRGGSRCKSCKAQVLFVKNRDTGAWMLVDWQPDWSRGNITLANLNHDYRSPVLAQVFGFTVLSTVETNRDAGVPYFIDHHATCPYADQHRKGRR